MHKTEFFFPSADGKTQIHCTEWTPEQRHFFGVLQIVHGITGHMGRYEPIAEFFTDRGFAVIGSEHIGHGYSIAEDAPPMYFGGAGSWEYVLEDVRSCRVIAGEHFGDLPHCLLGFSMGSYLVMDYLIRYPGTIDAAVLAGMGSSSLVMMTFCRFIAKLEERRVGETKSTPLIQRMLFDRNNRLFHPVRTGMDWLNSDENAVDAYLSDPFCRRQVTCGLFRELVDGMVLAGSQRRMNQMDSHTPLLLLSGDSDPVGRQGKGVKQVMRKLERSGCEDVTMRLYPGRHDILREKCSGKVLQSLCDWLDVKMVR